MARSGMTRAFLIGNVNRFVKAYRESNDELKNKNIVRYITIDVVNRKGVPDIDDSLLLIKLGTNNCTDEEAEKILTDWLSDEENKVRGNSGAFCELCKDFSLDIPTDSLFKQQADELESYINNRLSAMGNINKLLEQIGQLNKEASEKVDAQDDKEAELGVEEVSTQE